MHDIDRTQLETGWESQFRNGNGHEYEPEDGEFDPENDQFGLELSSEPYAEYDGEAAYGSPFSEVEEMELASELLSITDEAELDQFIGKLISKATKAAGRFARTPMGRALGQALKRVAKQALPAAGAALGNFVLPGIGGQIGGQLASGLGTKLGLELEGLSPEDQEFEVARRFVNLAGNAALRAASAPGGVSPQAVAQRAVSAAARKYVPGLVASGQRSGRRGAWVMRQSPTGRRTIVLYGL